MKNLTLSDFCKMEVLRIEKEATLIVDYFEGDCNKPIRMSAIGYITASNYSDFQIQEEGYNYYLKIIEELENDN